MPPPPFQPRLLTPSQVAVTDAYGSRSEPFLYLAVMVLCIAAAAYPQQISAKAGLVHSKPLGGEVLVDGQRAQGVFEPATYVFHSPSGQELLCSSDKACHITSPAFVLPVGVRVLLGLTAGYLLVFAALGLRTGLWRGYYIVPGAVAVLSVLLFSTSTAKKA